VLELNNKKENLVHYSLFDLCAKQKVCTSTFTTTEKVRYLLNSSELYDGKYVNNLCIKFEGNCDIYFFKMINIVP